MVEDFNLVSQGGEQTATNDRAVAIYLYPNVQNVVTMIDSDGRITNSIENGMETL